MPKDGNHKNSAGPAVTILNYIPVNRGPSKLTLTPSFLLTPHCYTLSGSILMKITLISFILFLLTGCVSAPPYISTTQVNLYYDNLELYKIGETVPKDFEIIEKVDGLSCTNKYGARTHGEEKGAFHIMKVKAASLNADAIIEYSCGKGFLVNNCWVPSICSGVAVKYKKIPE
ncbi:MAG: hypothetical protein KZQ93_11630 [Candidatus Thiodiazotropha sp. (ex Monitilora ramsayi)]|nr:hypothetical protein [Candidatus Thiodiazotropha sp. (ex Monitilora ramsayi)]